MICFSLEVNGRQLAVAGIPGFAVLSSTITWVRRRPRGSTLDDSELSLLLTGLDSNGEIGGTHVDWVNKTLAVGDRVVLEVLESDVSDPPKARRTQFTSQELQKERHRSARVYLKEYTRERDLLNRWIRECRKTIATEGKKAAPRKTRRR